MSLRIKELRTKKGLSQLDLAQMAGMSRSQLSEIEGEKKPATQRRLAAIAAALGVDVPALFSQDAREAYKGEIEALMRHMSEQDRLTILRMARALVRASEPDA
jgi:transcriptional regulator with XRE-family HTH domain